MAIYHYFSLFLPIRMEARGRVWGEAAWGKAETYMQNQRQTFLVPCIQLQPDVVSNMYKTYAAVKNIPASKQEVLQDLHACPEALNSKPSPQKNTQTEKQWRCPPYQLPTD